MKYGILEDKKLFKFFDKNINSRKFCKKCHKERLIFARRDKKHNNSYSNLLVGFSSAKINNPIDVLVITEAHGGGRQNLFREQKSLRKEVEVIGGYYLNDRIQKFHQYEMRRFFNWLDLNKKTWIFADLIRCFVWQGVDRQNKLVGKENIQKAIKHCRAYLDEEISFLKPRLIICLGRKVAREYFGIEDDLKHSSIYKIKLKGLNCTILWSYFPSRNTADIWVRNGGWEKIFTKLKRTDG